MLAWMWTGELSNPPLAGTRGWTRGVGWDAHLVYYVGRQDQGQDGVSGSQRGDQRRGARMSPRGLGFGGRGFDKLTHV